METSYFIPFLLALAASFLGALPFGTVNLTVVDTTIRKSFRAGLSMAVAAAFVEIIHSYLAVHCSRFITEYIEGSVWVKAGVVTLFVLLGAYFFFKKDNKEAAEKKKKYNLPDYAKAAILTLLNPQALPFWLFVVTWFASANLLDLDMVMDTTLIVVFLLGVSAGKFLALLLFAMLSVVIRKRVQAISGWMNKIIGSIFFLLALIQGIKFLF